MGGLLKNLFNCHWFTCICKIVACNVAIALCLISPVLADVSVYRSGSNYVVWDSPSNCLYLIQPNQPTFSNNSSRESCKSLIGSEPYFSDTFDSQFSDNQKTVGVALLLVLWPEIFSFCFLCFLLLGFLLVLPS
jgi:hypothetical protein